MYSQHCSINELSSISSRRIFSQNTYLIMHVNIRSLQHNLHKLQDLICDINPNPDFIAISETWLNSSSFFIPDLPNYDFLSSSTSCNRAGGVGIFYKNIFDVQLRSDIKLSTQNCEDLWVEVSGSDQKSVLIGVIY